MIGHSQRSATSLAITSASGQGTAVSGAYATGGSLSLRGKGRIGNNYNSGGGDLVFNDVSGAAVSELAGKFATLQSEQQKSFTETVGSLASKVFGEFGKLAETKATDGISGMSKTFLFLALGSMALLAWIWTRKEK